MGAVKLLRVGAAVGASGLGAASAYHYALADEGARRALAMYAAFGV
jgi:hypothetical protein